MQHQVEAGELNRQRATLVLAALLAAGACAGEVQEPVLVPVDLAALEARLGAGGGLRVVNLWATWCQPCVKELPELVALDAGARKRGIQVVGVSLDLAVPGDRAPIESRVREFLRQRKVSYENLLYTGSVTTLIDAFELPGTIPCTLVLGNDGTILWRHEGPTTRRQIETVLAAHGDRR